MIEKLKHFFSSMFASNSAEATNINTLFKDYLLIAAIILIIVTFLVIGGVIFFHHRRKSSEPRQVTGNKLLELAWTIIPLAIVTILFVLSLNIMKKINEPIVNGQKPDIVIIAHQWWWDFQYPKLGVVTANELHIPIGKKLLMRVESADVIHSWWVPDLGRKIDAIPGRMNYGWIEADSTGVFDGTCSEYCGTEHAWMRISVFAQTEKNFDNWIAEQKREAVTPSDSLARAGEKLFQQKTCGSCHTVAGTPANARIAPDLTHLASRETLLSGMEDNTPKNLRAWLDNPQNIKKGANMPDFLLSEKELDALTKYLEELK